MGGPVAVAEVVRCRQECVFVLTFLRAMSVAAACHVRRVDAVPQSGGDGSDSMSAALLGRAEWAM